MRVFQREEYEVDVNVQNFSGVLNVGLFVWWYVDDENLFIKYTLLFLFCINMNLYL